VNTKLESTERSLLAALLVLLTVAILGPVVLQPTHQHDFADQRFFGYLPFAADVLSNLPFAIWGLAGLLVLRSSGLEHLARTTLALAALFFTGLIVTAVASSWYHLQPDNTGLMVDRLGMTVAFAGLLGLAAGQHASLRAGALLSGLVLLLGAGSVGFWSVSGNLLPWLVLQFGGMGLILWIATRKALPGALAVRWGLVILIYTVAKVLELADHAVYDLTAHVISGHSLKHVVASFAAWPVVSAMKLSAANDSINYASSHKPRHNLAQN
jgi:hypothetical protein